jgi:hypothetical protein
MKHPGAQLPALHTWPPPHAVPFATLLHAVVLEPGWQLWQASPGFSAPGA